MSAPESINPYASPQAEQQTAPVLPSRHRALRIVRWTLIILILPVAINILATFYSWDAARDSAYHLRWSLAIANCIWFAFLFVVLFLMGLWLIELLARAFYGIFGGDLSREAWLTSLHESIWPMIPVAIIGSILWIVWLGLFFLAGNPGGYVTGVAFQVAGHILGACVYGNVFWNWYLLRREATT